MSSEGGGGAPLLGGIFSAGGSLMEASDKASAYNDRAWALNRNAALTKEQGDFNAMRQNIVANKKFGAISADYAASGVSSDSGSVLDVLASSHMNAEFDRQSILHQAAIRSSILHEQADYSSKAADRTTQMGYFNAFASLYGGAARSGMQSSGSGDNDPMWSGGGYSNRMSDRID